MASPGFRASDVIVEKDEYTYTTSELNAKISPIMQHANFRFAKDKFYDSHYFFHQPALR
jgi:hypothetical protein